MNIQYPVRSNNGLTLTSLETRLLISRTIFIEGEIDETLSMNVFKQLLILNDDDSSTPIKLLINSEGGAIEPGLLIYESILSSKAPIYTFAISHAFSMAAIIFVAGVKRFLLANSQLFLHQPVIGSNLTGKNTASIISIVEGLEKTQEKLTQILIRHTQKSIDEIEHATSFDHFFSAKEAISFGLADEVVTIKDIL